MNQSRRGGLLDDIVKIRDEALVESKRMYDAIERLAPVWKELNQNMKEHTKALRDLNETIKRKL